MATYRFKNGEINYDFVGKPGQPTIVFINGLTQRIQHWKYYRDHLNGLGYNVLLFDLMGQGASTKPTLFIDFRDNQKVLSGLLDHLNLDKVYIAGVSFGGVVTLRFAIEYPERTKGILPMSTFSEMDTLLYTKGTTLFEGMVKAGFEYLIKLFTMFNFSADWMDKNQEKLPTLVRSSFSYNDLYGIQNMMESLNNFKGFTPDLKDIKAPTLIMNGEYDYLTPRSCHETLRKHIKNSRLLLMQHVCHAFTIEIPEITCRMIDYFIKAVEGENWEGDQSVWIATDDPESEKLMYPCEGDYLRAIPVPKVIEEDEEADEEVNEENIQKEGEAG
ncbi:alpha/beta hydrolase [Serpentinicella sp. ANB-PHB4]|uniref:alpha/beta fold hydrolase n=1 Tax=Serpentinicella sp. ANB-PHB4 TaxID=3074076 RepID=UPI0028552B16|nr:alpha/beta hydrolase [Serpentinicella sp. ANB-PHB4]MDR5659261.1 alpha/beta hydrolase [Serpentinicella sp. ANB-PHB4]